MRSVLFLLGLELASLIGAAAQSQTPPAILNLDLLPPASPAGWAAYAQQFLMGNVNRAFAFGSNGAFGGMMGAKTIEAARERALDSCARKGASDCCIYAENLTVLPAGHSTALPPVAPETLIAGTGYAFIPDDRFFWYGPTAARGIVVWGHGYGGDDERGHQPPAFLRALNNDGYSIVRFDREPGDDVWVDRQTQHLHDGLVELRHRGWKRIVAGGQSRGGWNALALLKTPGVADVIITASAGPGTGTNVTTQILKGETMLYSLLDDSPTQSTRVAYIQFANDPYGGDKDKRAERLETMLRPKVGSLLLVDQPAGFTGHGAAYTARFAYEYGECFKRFVEDIRPPPQCSLGP